MSLECQWRIHPRRRSACRLVRPREAEGILYTGKWLNYHVPNMHGERLHIRALETDDLEEITALEQCCQPHPWSLALFRRELENPVSRFRVALFGERIVGYLCCWLIAGELEIHNIVTDPGCRRRGVARSLIEKALVCPEVETAFLEVRSGNSGAIALYRKLGFIETDCRRHYYHDGEDALLMCWQSSGSSTVPEYKQQES